jgi:8-oxo-dGTP pyrophosphatase MutT (NUDIX family)
VKQILRVSAYALLERDDRILLCRISPTVSVTQEWTLPGGGIEFGEHPADAAVREVFEETGYKISVHGDPHVDSERFEHAGSAAQALRRIYSGRIESGEMVHEVGGSTDRCDWLTQAEALAVPLVPLARLGIALAWPTSENAL